MLVILTALIAAAAPAAGAVPAPFVAGPQVEGVSEYALPNGLKVLFVPDPSKPTTTVNLTVMVGSRHEGYGEKGMAHLLEHMLFKGSKLFKDPKKELTTHGAEGNATTWFDRTNYFETFPASEANLDWALKFEADRFVNSFIAKSDLDAEMTVVRNEFEMGESSPDSVLPDRVLATAFLWHNYGNTTIGARSDIELVPIENLQAFYKRHYRPDNALLVVAGRFEPKTAFKKVADTFGKIPKPKVAISRTWTEEPVQDGERSVTVRRVGGNPLFTIGYHIPSGTDPDYAAVDVLSFVVGDSPSGRLYQQLVETKKAAKVACGAFQLKDPSFLFCNVELGPKDKADAARATLIDTLEKFASKPPTQEQVDRARTTLLKDIELVLNASDRVGIQLSEWAAMGDWRMLFMHRDRLEKVTVDDVVRVAKKYLKATNRTLGEYVPTEVPDRTEVPPAPDVAKVVKDYQGREAMAVGEAFDASPKNIETRTKKVTLPGGMKVAFLEKKTRGQTVEVTATLRFGTEKALMNTRAAGEFVAMLLSRGTKKHTREQFKTELDRLKAHLEVHSAPNGVLATLEVRKPQLFEAFALMVEALREPAFDAKEFETLRREVLASIEQQKTEPTSLGFTMLQRAMSPWPKGHPFYVPTFDEQAAEVNALRLEEVKAFHEKFYGANAGTAAVVGDFEQKDVQPKLEAAFGGWTSKEQFVRIAQSYRPLAAKTESYPLTDKANAFTGLGMAFSMKDSDPDYAAMLLADYLLGGGFMAGRIPSRLREKEGLSYGAGTFFRAPSLDDGAVLAGYAIYAPQNDAKVEKGFREELSKAVELGFTDGELSTARPGILQERQQRRANDGELARQLSQNLYLDRTMAWEEELDGRLRSISVKDIGAAVKKYLDPSKMALVKVGDFKAVSAPK
jgi:zinc protease